MSRFSCHFLFACCALILTACSSTAPSLMLVIDAEPGVRARITRIDLDVRGADNIMVFGQSYDLSTRDFPIRKSFVPRGGDLSRFIVATVSAYEAGSSVPLLVSRIRSGFANGQNEVRVLLLDGCIGQPCSDGTTCVVENGSPRCVATPVVVPIADAGVMDSSVVFDTATTDTARADTTSTDTATCVPDCDGRNCGIDPRCGTSCGTCTAGRCNTSRGVAKTFRAHPIAPAVCVAPTQPAAKVAAPVQVEPATRAVNVKLRVCPTAMVALVAPNRVAEPVVAPAMHRKHAAVRAAVRQ